LPSPTRKNPSKKQWKFGRRDPGQCAPKRDWSLYHKPECVCPLCKARRGKEKALAERAGDGGEDVAPPPKADPQVIDVTNPSTILIVKDKSVRSRVAEWAVYRSQGLKDPEIAERLGITVGSLHVYVRKAAREGWLKLDDPMDRLEHVLAPVAVDNIEYYLNRKDKQMTIETAKGIGLFRSHQAVKLDGAATQVALALKIDVIGVPTEPIKENVIGCPRIMDAEVVQE
jgi:transposase